MGRLTLNVLLSFAQFEREITAERIRDKIAASKKKGMWMGGMVPWGYKVHSDPKIQSLEICEERSSDIRHIYDLYEQLGCLSKVKLPMMSAVIKPHETYRIVAAILRCLASASFFSWTRTLA